MFRNEIYDVIVIGAGPAGAFTSLKLSEKGIKTLLIEKRERIGEPVQCGEGLSEYALRENNIKPEDIFIVRKMKGSKTFTPSGYYLIFPIPGFIIKRNIFDKYLTEKAQEKKTKLKTGEKVLLINKKRDLFEIISDKDKYYSKFVVLATGPYEGIKGILYPEIKKITAIEFRFEPNDIDDEYFHFYFGDDFKPFYGWVFFHGYETGVGTGFYDRGNTLNTIKILIKKYGLEEKKITRKVAGKIPFSKPLFPPDPDGILRTGDAIGAVHPFTAGGIHGALTTGRIAAETIIENFDKKEEINRIYYKKIKKIPIFQNSLWQKQKILFNKSSKEWDEIGKLMNGRDYYKTPWFRAILYLFLHPFSIFNLLYFLNLQKEMKISENYSY